MTSREQTGLLPRAHDANDHVGWLDRLAVALFAPLTTPYLLRSLSGGNQAEKERLLDRLDLPGDALPNLGGWKADAAFLNLIVDIIEAERPRRVLEFGIGASSLVIAAALKKAGCPPHRGFDQHREFVGKTANWLASHGLAAELQYAPLHAAAGWPGLWYDIGETEGTIDLIIIDGPPWTLHPMTRGGAAALFHRLAPGGTLLLDDAARPGERLVARRWRREFPEIAFRYWNGGGKGALIGKRRA